MASRLSVAAWSSSVSPGKPAGQRGRVCSAGLSTSQSHVGVRMDSRLGHAARPARYTASHLLAAQRDAAGGARGPPAARRWARHHPASGRPACPTPPPTADDVGGQLHAGHRAQQRVAHPLKLRPRVLPVHAAQHGVAARLDLQGPRAGWAGSQRGRVRRGGSGPERTCGEQAGRARILRRRSGTASTLV